MKRNISILLLGLLLGGPAAVFAQANTDMAVRGLIYGGFSQGEALAYTPSEEFTKPLTKTQAEEMAAQYVTMNPNLEVRKVQEKDEMYVVEVVTKKGRNFVNKMSINKETGTMQSVIILRGRRGQGKGVGVGRGGRGMGRSGIGGGRGMGRGGIGGAGAGIRGGGIRAGQGGSCCATCVSSNLTYNASGELEKPLTKNQAEELAAGYIVRNPNLKVGVVTKKDDRYVVEIVTTKEGDLVDKIAIDEKTAKIRPVK